MLAFHTLHWPLFLKSTLKQWPNLLTLDTVDEQSVQWQSGSFPVGAEPPGETQEKGSFLKHFNCKWSSLV